MGTANISPQLDAAPPEAQAPDRTSPSVLVCLGVAYDAAPADQMASLFHHLASVAGRTGLPVTIAYPAAEAAAAFQDDGFVLQPYRLQEMSHTVAVQTAGAYQNAAELMRTHNADCCVLLGAEADSLDPDALAWMIDSIVGGRADLALPRYSAPADQGLLNSALLLPLSRAMYGVRVRYPLALDLAMSRRMAERMAASVHRLGANLQGEAVLWPVAEAAVAGYTVAEVACGPRILPVSSLDLQGILNSIVSPLFSDLESKASFWQRSRSGPPVVSAHTAHAVGTSAGEPLEAPELEQMLQTFRLGYANLHELWSLVLPPNTLLGLKRLSAAALPDFNFADALWVRVVYDFVLAHRLRTINRGHLMGAFAPLYLAWVASHLESVRRGGDPEAHVEQVARSFEADKPYLVSRWRWPDRFNP